MGGLKVIVMLSGHPECSSLGGEGLGLSQVGFSLSWILDLIPDWETNCIEDEKNS